MNSEMKRLISKFLFANGIIACALLFFCGSITVAERTAYNVYLQEYAVLSVASRGQKLYLEGRDKEISLKLPEKEAVEKLLRYMKLTPLAGVVFLCESIDEAAGEFLRKCIDISEN